MIVWLIVGIILLLFFWYVLKPRTKDENGFKMWSFNESSWHARYYKWVISSKLPQGGCVYFWSMVSLVLLSEIIFTIWLIVTIIEKIDDWIPERERKIKHLTEEEWNKKWKKEDRMDKLKIKLIVIFGKIFVGAFIIFIIGSIIYAVLHAKRSQWIHLFTLLGIISATGLIVWGWIAMGIGKGALKILKPLGYPFKYIGSMIVAIYTKSCPKITWNKTETITKI